MGFRLFSGSCRVDFPMSPHGFLNIFHRLSRVFVSSLHTYRPTPDILYQKWSPPPDFETGIGLMV